MIEVDYDIVLNLPESMPWSYSDGGRQAAGFRGITGDCATRAIAIATMMPYREVYDLVNEFGKRERRSKRRTSKSSARTGVYQPTMRKIMDHLGWEWFATMQIGSGCQVHLRPSELPDGRLIVNLSKHYAAVVDGHVLDTHDPGRNGTRCVYGYWRKND